MRTAFIFCILIVGMKTDKTLIHDLGKRIREIRSSLDMTQYEFSTKVGVNKNYIGMLERGERNPSYLTLKKIANNLSVSIHDLLP